MSNVVVFCDKNSRELIIPDFKEYFNYVGEQAKKHLKYSSIKRFIRLHLDELSNSVFVLNITDKGLNFSSVVGAETKELDCGIAFVDSSVVMCYKEYTPFFKMLSTAFEMSDLTITRKKVEIIPNTYTFGISNGKLTYSDEFSKSMAIELEKVLASLFKADSFNNLYRVKF